MSPKGHLILLPNTIHEEMDKTLFLPPIVAKAVFDLDGLIAESEKGARAFLKGFSFSRNRSFRDIPISLLNEHVSDLKMLLAPLKAGQCWGLISDAGLPCFADPGAPLIAEARKNGIEVEGYVGPSAILLALLLSGFSAQNFAFHGYLPQEEIGLCRKLEEMEKDKKTHVFIEAPYRSDKLLSFLIKKLKPFCNLAIASNLGSKTPSLKIKKIEEWRKLEGFIIGKNPTVFLISA